MRGSQPSIYCVAVSIDTRYIVSGSNDNTIAIWNFQEKTQEAILKEHIYKIWSVKFTNDSNFIVSGSSDNTILVWDLHTK